MFWRVERRMDERGWEMPRIPRRRFLAAPLRVKRDIVPHDKGEEWEMFCPFYAALKN